MVNRRGQNTIRRSGKTCHPLGRFITAVWRFHTLRLAADPIWLPRLRFNHLLFLRFVFLVGFTPLLTANFRWIEASLVRLRTRLGHQKLDCLTKPFRREKIEAEIAPSDYNLFCGDGSAERGVYGSSMTWSCRIQ